MNQSASPLRSLRSLVGAAFAVTCLSTAAMAVNLPPGSLVPLGGVAGGSGPGLVVQDPSIPFRIFSGAGALLYEGTLRDRVVRLDATGTLAFERLVTGTNGSLNGLVAEVTCTDYATYLTDVEYSTTSIGSTAPNSASRTPDGSAVTFHFARTPVDSGAESRFFYIRTEALQFESGGKCVIKLTTGESTSVEVVRPARHVEPGCRPIDFEDIPAGTIFPAGSTFASSGVLMHLRPFFWDVGSCTNETPGNVASVDDGDMACTASHELAVNNVNVAFDYGVPLLGMVIYFGEYGGNVNLNINGQCVSEQNFSDVPPVIGGVSVTVDEPNPGQGCGRIFLEGMIHEVSIGGQEFWIDGIRCEPDVCFDDDVPPVAEITEPGDEVCVCDPVDIYGTADDANFADYVLEYRRTTDATWTVITSSNTPVVGGLLGTWNAAGLPQGRYLLRLTVHDLCGHTETDVIVVWLGTAFDTLDVRSPNNGDILGGTICFDGTVWDNYCFDNYYVEYEPAGGTAWSPVEPAHPVYTSTVINDPFAHWDTIDLGNPDGDYRVRVRAYDDCGNSASETRGVVVDNTWPDAEIASPLPCDYVEGVVEVYGTANDANLASWVLQYTGGAASSWVTIASGSGPVVGGLLGEWDTTSLRPCAYTLRLVVTDAAVVNCNGAIHHRSEYTVSVNVGACGDFDVDDDGDVDLFDYHWFEQAFTGP